jgi:hypothetical protein
MLDLDVRLTLDVLATTDVSGLVSTLTCVCLAAGLPPPSSIVVLNRATSTRRMVLLLALLFTGNTGFTLSECIVLGVTPFVVITIVVIVG